MASEFTLTMLDYSGEKSPAKFTGATPVEAGFNTWNGLMDALQNATEDISLGKVHKSVRASNVALVSNEIPTDPFSQRELKWLVTYKANTSEKLFRLEIPCALPE